MSITKLIKTRLSETGTAKTDITHDITITIDFDACSRGELEAWAAKDRIIVFQNNNRKTMTVEKYMSMDGGTFKVSDLCKSAGRQVVVRDMTDAEIVAHYDKDASEEGMRKKAELIEMLMKSME